MMRALIEPIIYARSEQAPMQASAPGPGDTLGLITLEQFDWVRLYAEGVAR